MDYVYTMHYRYYNYFDDDYDAQVLLFKDLESAEDYFNNFKENIIAEALEYTHMPDKDALRIYELTEDFIESDDYFYMSIEDYGYDSLKIKKSPILSFLPK